MAVVGLALTLVLGATPALAQAVPNAAADESLTQKSRELFAEGNAYSAEGDFVRARAALKAAWGLMHHWGIAANLGEVELELGHHRDAAEMLAFALRNWPDKDWEAEKKSVGAAFEKARARVGAVDVEVDVQGATLLVDGEVVGRAPMAGAVFVEPGRRVFSAEAPRLGSVESVVVLKAGESGSVSLRLDKPSEPETPTKSVAENAGDEHRKDSGATKAIVVGTGAGLTLVAAGVAIVYGNKAGTAQDNVDRLRDQRDATIGANGCGGTSQPAVCVELADELDERNQANRVAGGAWVGAGVLAGATLATYFLWPSDEEGETSVVPTVWKDTAFVSVEGRF